MSNRVQNRKPGGSTDRKSKPGGSTDWQQMTKAERRTAAKAAKARAAAAKRRRQALAYTLAGLAVVGVIIAAFFVFRGFGDTADTVAASSSAAPGATATAANAADKPAFPPLPAGADPALGTKPTTSAGTGELTALKATPLVEGKGAAAQSGRQITVNYVGVSFKDGKEFDSSWSRSEPFSFQLGGGNVIPGWDQGLVGVKVGSRVQLDIPSDLAYGDNAGNGQPSGPLRFIVDVLAVQ